jgi:6-phosphogluconolactonase
MTISATHSGGAIRRRSLLKGAAALAVSGPAVLGATRADPQSAKRTEESRGLLAYVGAFTTPERKAHGNGINVYRMDPRSGAWTHIQLLPNIVNPSFLAVDREQRHLYSVHADLDEVGAYAIDKETGQLTPLNRQSCRGKNPVYLAIDPSNRFIVTANYGSGSVGVVPIEKDGTLGSRTDLVMLPGEPGPNRKEQASLHPHDCPFDPAGRFILVPDKGLDRVFGFRLDGANGKLTPNDPPFVATREGAGPRHIAFTR